MGSLLSIGISALNAAQTGLLTTSHNISNVNTPNYSRQQVVQATNTPQFTGGGFIGQGVHVDTVRRIYSDSLQQQVQQANAGSSQLNSYYTQIQQIDNLLADPSSGLSPALNDFFNGVQAVASNPNDTPSRQAMLSSAQTLSSRFADINNRFAQLRGDVNQQVRISVDQINSTAQGIASLNQSIALANSNASQGQVPNDLLDQRDALITALNKEIGATVVNQSDGSVNVFIGNGQTLVMGNQANKLAAVPDTQDPSNLQLALLTGAATMRLPSVGLQGGNLAGLLAFRDQSLNSAENALGRVAIGLSSVFNAQHELGQDQNGALGTAFFTAGSPQVIAATGNSVSAAIGVNISSLNQLTTSDYRLQYDGANYNLTRLSDNTVQTFATLPQTVDGLTLSITSPLASGDSFLIQPTHTGARDFSVAISDTAKIAAAAPVRASSGIPNTGSAAASALSVTSPPPTNANLQQSVTITFTAAGAFNVSGTGTGNPTGVAYTSGNVISYNGWNLTLSGTPAAGDTFTVAANSTGVADNRNALLLAGLQTQNAVGGTTLQGAYAQMVSQVGSQAHQLQVASAAQDNLLSQVQQARDSVSAVNLDEEAANLLRYQQAYLAASKTIAAASTMFDAVMKLFN
jgi:flagellar hook-associated protein 1 FlgK